MIDFDVETTGLQPWSQAQTAFLYIFLDDEGNLESIRDDDPLFRARIQGWFNKAKKDPDGIRAWNAKFDRAWGEAMGFDMPGDGRWHDGMLEAQAINERRSVALKAVAVEMFGEDADDLQKKVKKWLTDERARRKKAATAAGTELVEPNYSDVPKALMEIYGKEDVILTRKVCDILATRLAQIPDLQRCVEFERKTMDALYAVEKRGIPASQHDYRMLELEANENLDGLRAACVDLMTEAGLEDPNPNSTPDILTALRARDADMSFMETKDGKIVSADADNLRAVDDELAAAVLEFRSEFKVLSTYVRPMLGRHYDSSMRMWREPFIAPDGRVHATYRQVGARTGRMSCSDPNMQNQPRDDLRLRYCIRAEPGYKLVTCDLSNIEMVLFAAYAGEGRLLTTLLEGGDMHVLTAEMLGLRDRERAGGVFESARQQGKTYNFSRVYGGGLRTIRKSFRCDLNTARLYKKRFDDAYPEVMRLAHRIKRTVEDQGYLADTIISGRRFRVHANEEYKATNWLVQGTAAALLKYALIQLHGREVPVVALIHDEVVAHVPESQAEDTQATIIECLTNHPGFKGAATHNGEQVDIPLRADGAIVDHWSDAKPNKDGTLFIPKWVDA